MSDIGHQLKYDRYEQEEKKYERDGYSSRTGFQSPTDDHYEDRINFSKTLIPNPLATIPIKIEGNSMIDAKISSGDILLIDKSLSPQNGDIVFASFEDKFTVRIFFKKNETIYLIPRDKKFKTIIFNENTTTIEGVVTFIIHNARQNRSTY